MPIYELDGQGPEFPADGQYWVAETAVLIGRVRMKSHSSIWFGAVLRGDNEWIELANARRSRTIPRCTPIPVSDGDRLELRDRPQGHAARLHGRRQQPDRHGRDPAQRLQNRQEFAGWRRPLVTEGKSFPDNALIVGAPARAIRTLDEKA